MITRRNFIVNMAAASLSQLTVGNSPIVFGHNNKRYTLDHDWAKNQRKFSISDCHEMVQTADGHILLLTNDVKNNFLKIDKKGNIIAGFGSEFPGGHGLSTYNKEEQLLLVTDTVKNEFYKVNAAGKVLQRWEYPKELDIYKAATEFIPTETVTLPNGEFYVADGYGAQYIIHYGSDGKVKNYFGGRGEGDIHFDCAHGITLDTRQKVPTLLVTDRSRCAFKQFALDGTYLGKIELPGANVCRPVIKGDHLYAAVLTSSEAQNTGFVLVLDKENKAISALAASTPAYTNNLCSKLYQTVKLFKHPHDVLVDDEENLYVCQWNSGGVLPLKFTPYV